MPKAPLPSHSQQDTARRRDVLRHLLIAASSVALQPLIPQAAHASKLGEGADRAWEAMGGGPGDLFFPDEFSGRWRVRP